MECIVEHDDGEDGQDKKNNITFLYTLGDGPCRKSFGVDVARLAGLPNDVLQRAQNVSSQYEARMERETNNQQNKINPLTAEDLVGEISKMFSGGAAKGEALKRLWASLQ